MEQPAVSHVDLPRRGGGHIRIVGDEDHRHARRVEVVEQRHHLGARCAVEVPGRLIGQQEAGLGHQGAGDRHALLLATG